MAALLRAHPAPVPVPRGQAGHPLPVGTVPFVERVAAPPDEEDVHPPVPQTPKPRVVATPTPLPRRGPGGIRARHSGQPGRVWGDGGAKSRGRKPTGYNAPENSGLASPNFVADHPTSGTSSSPNRLHGKGSDKKPRHWVPPKVRPAVVAPSPGGSQAVYASHTSMGTSAPLRRAFRGHAPASPLQHPPPSKAKQNPFRRPATSAAGTGDVRVSTLRNSATGELRLARTQAALTAFADPFFHPTGGLDGGDSVDVDDGFGVDGGPSLRSVASFHSLRQGGGARARNRRLRRGGGRSTGDLHTRGGGVDAATASLVPTRFHRRGAARNKDVVDNLTADGSKRARVVAALAPASSSTQATPSRFRREIEAFAQSPLVKVNPPVQKQHHVVSRDVSFLQDTGSSTEAHHLLVGPTVSGVLAQPSNGERPMTSLAGGFPRSLSMVDEDEPSLHGQLSSTAPPKFGRRSTRKVSSASADGLRRSSMAMEESTALIPPSLIPVEDHIKHSQKVSSSLTPDNPSVYDASRQEWVTTIFPAARPTGRRDVELLDAWINKKQAELAGALPGGGSDRRGQRGGVSHAPPGGPGDDGDSVVLGEGSAPYLQFLPKLASVVKASTDKGGEVAKADAMKAALAGDGDGGPAAEETVDDEAVMAAMIAAPADGMASEDILAVIHKAQRMYSIGFHEIVRQVSVSCIERGQLLAKVWAGYMALFEQLEQLQHPLRDDIRLLREKVAEQVNARRDAEDRVMDRDASIARLQADLQTHVANEKVLRAEMAQARREVKSKDLKAYAEPQYRQWAHLSKLELLKVTLQMHKDGEEARATKKKLESTTKTLAHTESELARVRDDLATARTELEQATLELESAVKVNESLTHSVYQLEDRIVSQDNVVGEMRATIDDQATQLAAPPRIVPMWPELPPKHEPKLKRFLDEIVAKDAEIEALKEHIRKTQTFKLPGIDSDSVTNPYGMSMVDPTERGTQTTINMGNMDSMVEMVEEEKKRAEAKRLARLDADKRAKASIVVPAVWKSMISLLPAKCKVSQWGLARLKRMILTVYIEKIKADASGVSTGPSGDPSPATHVVLPPFVVEFLYNTYGVRRVVQMKLKQLLVSMEKYIASPRVNFFARVVGYLHKKPVTPSKFSFFLNALSALVTEVESSNLRWVTTNQGTTWVPESACVLCVRRLHHSSPSALEAAEHLLSKLPRRPPRTSRSDPGTKSSPREFVDLDVFLDAMTESYQQVEDALLSLWDRVFTNVDEDLNGVLDIDEYMNAIRRIPDLRCPPALARKVFIEETQFGHSDFIDRPTFRKLIGKLFHMTSMFTSSQKRLYSHMNSSNVAAGSPPPTEPDAATALQPSGTGGGDDAPPPLANPIDEKTAQSIAAAAGSSGWTVAPPKPTFTTNAGAGVGAGAQADTADGAVRERPKPPRSAPSRRRPRRMSLDRQQVALAQMAVVLSTKNVQGDADALRKFEAHDCAHHTEFEDLYDVWGHIKDEVDYELSRKHQSPATRLHLLTSAGRISDLIDRLLELQQERLLATPASGSDTGGEEEEDHHRNHGIADAAAAKRLRETWAQVHTMIADLRSAVKLRRRNSALYIQRLVRAWAVRHRARTVASDGAGAPVVDQDAELSLHDIGLGRGVEGQAWGAAHRRGKHGRLVTAHAPLAPTLGDAKPSMHLGAAGDKVVAHAAPLHSHSEQPHSRQGGGDQ